MPHAELALVSPPTIEPLGSQIGGRPDQICKTTLIQISTDNNLHKIYFTTDGSTPDAFNRHVGGREITHKYKAPFALKPGIRGIKAIAYTRNGKHQSRVAKRQFEVLHTDTDLSQIGEEDEDVASTSRSQRLGLESVDADDNEATGRARYMARLQRHLDQSALSSGSDLDFETPRSIQSMLNRIETPHSVVPGRDALPDSDLSSSEYGQLQELEAEYQQAQQDVEYRIARVEEDYERAQEREDSLRRRHEDEEYLQVREREEQLRAAHREEQRRRAWDADPGCRDCECENDDDGATHVTDFFYSSNNRLNNSYDRYQNGSFSGRSNGSSQKTDRDYGITGVTARPTVNGELSRQEILCTGNGNLGSSNAVDIAYRRKVDNELMENLRAKRDQEERTRQLVVADTDCAECRTALSPYAERGRPDTGRYDVGRRSEVDVLFQSDNRYDPLVCRRSSRSRSRERVPQGILKRGTSLERARSREREREVYGRRRSRSRSRSADRRQSRSRERTYRRSPSRSPESRHVRQLMDDLDVESLPPELTPRFRENERRRAPQSQSDPEYRSRSRQPKVTGHRDAQMSLEEIEVRLSQFEDSDSSVNPPREQRGQRPQGRGRAQESATVLKKKKDSANLMKSNISKKKPAARSVSPPLSSVSSSLSSSSSSSEEEQKEKEKESEKVEKKATKSKTLPIKVVVPRVAKADAPVGAGPQKNGKKKAEGALNFFNDSGTQINFWGVSPDEIAQKLRDEPGMQEARAAVSGAVSAGTRSTPSEEPDSEVDEAVDSFFITESRPRVKHNRGGQAARQSTAHSENYVDDDDGLFSVEPVQSGEVRSAPVSTSQQADQHGIFSNIGTKIKSFFGGDDKKGKDAAPAFTKVIYDEEKKKCRKSKKLWEDPDFPVDDSSLFHTEKPQTHPFEWKRPHEICKNPQFIVGGASRFDVKQGVLGNCWLLAAVASLAGDEKLLYRIIYPEQSFQKEYAGIFRFQFWVYGEWLDVCVDDRLPTKNGRLVYMHSAEANEFWSPLLEKAYAKLNGCYENLSGGLTSEAMTDFTGGLVECFNFREELPDNMFQILRKAFDRGSLLGCSIDASPDSMEEQLDNGLIIGHAYSLTDVKLVAGQSKTYELVRVRNPWGNHCEWTGAWSDSSKEWQSIPEKTRKKLGIAKSHDGEFWMSIRDFTTHFQRVEICNQDRTSTGAWESTFINNAWLKNVNAGGCRNFPDTYPTNPQFRVDVTDVDDDDEEQIGTVIIALMQKARRRLRPCGGGNLTIGYDIFQVGSKSGDKLEKKFFRKSGPVATSPQYINQREVTGRHRLPPGNYVVLPTTFESNEEADFLLRIYSEKEAGLMESDVTTSVNTKISAKTMATAHSAPGAKRKSQAAKQLFQERSGEDLEVDAYELLDILNTTFTKDFSFGSFNINSCRSMVAIRDTDATGKLGYEEFQNLWDDLMMWKQVFQTHDKDESGFFSSFELREALQSVGYNLSNVTFRNIVIRYSDREGRVQFNDFLDCLVRLKTLFEIYGRGEQGSLGLSLDEFIATMVYT